MFCRRQTSLIFPKMFVSDGQKCPMRVLGVRLIVVWYQVGDG